MMLDGDLGEYSIRVKCKIMLKNIRHKLENKLQVLFKMSKLVQLSTLYFHHDNNVGTFLEIHISSDPKITCIMMKYMYPAHGSGFKKYQEENSNFNIDQC